MASHFTHTHILKVVNSYNFYLFIYLYIANPQMKNRLTQGVAFEREKEGWNLHRKKAGISGVIILRKQNKAVQNVI